jgi:hypothetical protein
VSSARTATEAVEVLVVNGFVPPAPARLSADVIEVLINPAGIEPSLSRTGITMFRR